jgi:hypothetical protein
VKKTIIKEINKYDYTLVDNQNNEYVINIEFYSNYKPQLGDVIYFDDIIINETNLYAFDEVYDTKNIDIKDIIKVVHEDKEYYFQRRYG